MALRRRLRRNALLVLGGLIIGAGLLVYADYRQDIDAAYDRVSTGSQLVDTPCGRIEYAVSGTGRPLLVVHGAGGGFDQSLETARPLIGSGFQLIAMSRFGYLRTPVPADTSPMAQADAHTCLLDALDLEAVPVLGASIGAPSTIQLCLRHPERCGAMVLLVPVAYSPPDESQETERPSAFVQFLANAALRSDLVFWLGTRVGREAVLETLLATPYTEMVNASPAEQERVFRLMRNILPISARADGLEIDMSTDLPRYALERVDIPTLVISTETDLFSTFKIGRYTAGQIPGARFLGYPTGGHVWIGRDEEIWSEVATFLNNMTGAPQGTAQRQ